jgi:hypothetical protein
MKRFIIALSLVFLVTSFLQADIYVKNMERTNAFTMMGKQQPEKVEVKEQWLTKNKFAIFTKEAKFIVDFEKKNLYAAIHKLKQYYRFPTDINRETLKKFVPADIAEAITSVKLTIANVKLNTGTKKIASWNCVSHEFEMSFMIPKLNIMPKLKLKMWTTEDLPFDYKEQTLVLGNFFKNFFLDIPTVDEASLREIEELDTIKGMQVGGEVVISIFGNDITIETQCLEAAEKTAPAGTYSVPEGYQKKEICCTPKREK